MVGNNPHMIQKPKRHGVILHASSNPTWLTSPKRFRILPWDFLGTISGFGTGDTIDATNFAETATSYSFLENSMGTGGTLTLHDASLTANILMTGDYSNKSFSLAPDSGTGTLVKFV